MSWETAQKQSRGLLRDLADEVRGIPGVTDVALVSGGVPLRGDLRTIDFDIPGRSVPPGQDLDFNEIPPDYFLTLRVPLHRGRFFTDADTAHTEPVIIINAAAARRFFGDENPVGHVVRFQGLRRIVGVVGNIRHEGLETDWRSQGFIPLEQSEAVNATLVARLSREPGDVLPAIKASV